MMTREFTDFLAAQRVITPEQTERVQEVASKVREPIGSIAFSYGLLTGDDVDVVLTEQRKEHRQFGEIAASMGMLTRGQVESLVYVQQIRGVMEIAEALVLAGVTPPDTMFSAVGRFLSTRSESNQTRRAA